MLGWEAIEIIRKDESLKMIRSNHVYYFDYGLFTGLSKDLLGFIPDFEVKLLNEEDWEIVKPQEKTLEGVLQNIKEMIREYEEGR